MEAVTFFTDAIGEMSSGQVDASPLMVMPLTYRLQLLHYSDSEAGFLAPQTAPYLAALVDG